MVDGIVNGNFNYGGGVKVNCYIDIENLCVVEVFQGMVDVVLCLNEVFGGILNFMIINLGMDEQLVVSVIIGDFGV